ncbi:DNA excision repair protein ERCC-6-like [Pholidichthys leucotaenia]
MSESTEEDLHLKLEKSLCIGADEEMEKYHSLIQDGKEIARGGDMHKALELFKQAYNIHQSQKLENRIKKIEELIAENDSDEDEEFINIENSGLMLFKELHDQLYDYQRGGVAFLYSLYRDGRKGGILADDMGLGKTIQVISFLSGMYDSELIKHTLLIMPTSLITNWTKEFAKWTPGMRVKDFHGSSKVERTRNLEKVQRRSGVIITTYTMLLNNWQQLSSYNGREFTWDYMILDEAHKIKSTSTKTAKSAYAIPSKNRILLTGTPVQNNLREMWALFDFACQGTLLGTAKTFKSEYDNPITRAREKDATPGEKALGARMSENLMTIIKPYFLRRTKSEVQKNNNTQSCREGSLNSEGNLAHSGAVMPKLTRKNDLIVWTYLSAIQEDIYQQFLSLDHIKELLMTSKSPLAQLNILKKLCDHPRLLSAAAIANLGLEESEAEGHEAEETETDAHSIANVPDDTLISESGKMVFLFALLERLREEGHRTLVFARYRKVLDIIQRILSTRGFGVLRLDGTITQVSERERLISLFQKDKRYSVFLLTTQVGGVGITLTGANRVVIYDPSWNPATDAQAVDRAYRIGQTENVVIYRLITCGTVEEKIYRRQVFKDSLIRQNTGDKKNPFRYFSKQELKELFTLEDTRLSTTQLQLQALHSQQRRSDPELDEHIAHLHAMEMFGISDHDLMFSVDVHNDEAIENQEEHHYIEGRVQKAQELMKAESALQLQLADSMAGNSEAAWLRYPVDNTSNRKRSQEKKPRTQQPSPSCPQMDQIVNEFLDKSASGFEMVSKTVIDLTLEDSVNGDLPEENQNSSKNLPAEDLAEAMKESVALTELAYPKPVDMSVREQPDKSTMSNAAFTSAIDGSPLLLTAPDDDDQQLNKAFSSRNNDSEMDSSHHRLMPPPKNTRLSQLQVSHSSFKTESSRDGTGLESFNANFNLQLEDSEDMFSSHYATAEPQQEEEEEEEQKLLSQLQRNGSFDVNKSLSEWRRKEASMVILDESNDSIVTTKKKRAAVIYDSDEEEEEQLMKSQLENSFQVLGASTPKSRKSVGGGNTSVASRRSLLQSIIDDMDANQQQEEEDVSEMNIDEEEEPVGSEEEEPSGETLNSEVCNTSEEDVEEEEGGGSGSGDVLEDSSEQMSSSVEESTGEPELASSERLDEYTSTAAMKDVGQNQPELPSSATDDDVAMEDSEDGNESYDWLVRKGRECFSKSELDAALAFFLRAIDIQPGDPEVQLMTIRLYRQMSHKR